MDTLIATYQDVDAAQQALLDLSAEGFERRHIHLARADEAQPAELRVGVDPARLEEASKILTRHHAKQVRRERADEPGADGKSGLGGTRPSAEASTRSPAAGAVRHEGKGGQALSEFFDEFEPEFREHFQRHAGSSETFDEYRQAYLEGTRLGTDFQSRDWSEVEQEGRRRWEHNQHPKPWAKVRDHVKHGWGRLINKRGRQGK